MNSGEVSAESDKITDIPFFSPELARNVAEIVRSCATVEQTLGKAAEAARERMGADDCAAFVSEGGGLVLRAGGLAAPDALGSFKVEHGAGVAGTAAARGEPFAASLAQAGDGLRVFDEIGENRFSSALAAPVMDGDEVLGVISVYSIEPRRFTGTEGDGLVSMLRLVGGVVGCVKASADIATGYRRMTVLNEIDQILDSVPDSGELPGIISKVCAERLSVRACALRLFEPGTKELRVESSYGVDPRAMEKIEPEWKKVSEWVVREGRPRVAGGGEAFGSGADGGFAFGSALVAPLVTRGEIIGALELFDRLSPFQAATLPFDDGEVEFVSTLAAHIAHALDNARLLRDARKFALEYELRLRELSLLFEITTILRSSLDLEEILYMILTCVTIGQGLGFNRAMLFLMDEEEELLLGKMGVGPLRPEEARNYWDVVDTAGKTLTEIVREYGQFNMRAGFEVDRLVKEISIDVKNDSGVLARTVREKTSCLEEKYAAPGNSSEREFFNALALSSFAVVPLVAKDRVVGAIMVDNLATRETITRDDLTFLMLFANQAASAIEMARAYKYLEMTNRELTDARDLLVRHKTLATLGEFSAGVAHELRNPLVSIGGFARRLIRSLPPDSDARNYARIISTEVEGLEQILSQILDFVAGVKPRKKKVDMNVLLEHVLQLFRGNIESAGIRVETELDEAARYLIVDEVQMRQLFINLVKNAVEAMPEGGKLNVRSAYMGNEDVGVGFEVSDTGHGIAPEDMEKVFTPFFTRKDKGMGLGLSISSRIVEGNHGGRMFLDSKRGQGTSVLVWLPLSTLPENGE